MTRSSRLPSQVVLLAAGLACTLVSACTTSPSAGLVHAIDRNDFSAGSVQLDAGVDPNATSAGGEPVLNAALERRSERLAQLLLARGANPNSRDREGRPAIAFLSPAIPLAQSRIDTGLVGIIVEHASRRYVCARELSRDTVQQIIKRTSDVNIHFPSRGGELLTALTQASACGHIATMKNLLDAGASVNATTARGDTALSYAAAAGYGEAAQLLLDRGANVNVRGSGGATPLLLAAGEVTPFHRAAVEILLKRGAAVNGQDQTGDTALIIAARNDDAGVAAVLLEAGADPAVANAKGETAASISHGAVRQLLSNRSEK